MSTPETIKIWKEIVKILICGLSIPCEDAPICQFPWAEKNKEQVDKSPKCEGVWTTLHPLENITRFGLHLLYCVMT